MCASPCYCRKSTGGTDNINDGSDPRQRASVTMRGPWNQSSYNEELSSNLLWHATTTTKKKDQLLYLPVKAFTDRSDRKLFHTNPHVKVHIVTLQQLDRYKDGFLFHFNVPELAKQNTTATLCVWSVCNISDFCERIRLIQLKIPSGKWSVSTSWMCWKLLWAWVVKITYNILLLWNKAGLIKVLW